MERWQKLLPGSPPRVAAVRQASEQLGLAHEHFFSDSFVPGPAA